MAAFSLCTMAAIVLQHVATQKQIIELSSYNPFIMKKKKRTKLKKQLHRQQKCCPSRTLWTNLQSGVLFFRQGRSLKKSTPDRRLTMDTLFDTGIPPPLYFLLSASLLSNIRDHRINLEGGAYSHVENLFLL